ncbi:PIR Superfamily Protein [Plasmodium ovale curtisi]|uniref:PIR Superfamily Protein n=1 Tax=Plasmodium ovale curtisi TaxID=864141 RepID=A0A1A8X0G7_PLAOA|nr:PIR Superfamily Protein [Plasmodium ovale curtisi]
MTQSEKILKDLTKYKLYEKFNKNEDKDKYSRFCRSMNYVNRILIGFSDLCHMYARNLVTLPKILKGEINENENCRYFTFWIHDEIRKIDSSRWLDSHKIKYILNKFYQVQESIKAEKQNNDCFYEYRSDIELNLWKKWKDLYDYIINFEDIKSTVKSDGNLCKLYDRYFDYISEVHKKYKTECCNSDYSPICPDGIRFNKWCNEDEIFKKLECNQNKAHLAASIRDGGTFDPSEQQESGGTNLKTVLQFQSDYSTTDEALTNNTDYYTKLSVPLLLLGLSSTFFYLYNFTSLGPLVRSKILGKGKIKDNINEDAQNLLEYYSNNIGSNFDDNDFHIKYNPS